MSEEAEAAVAAPEQSSAPETKVETEKPVAAEPEQSDEDKAQASSEVAEEEDADPAGAETETPKKKPTRTSQLRATIREKALQIEALERRLAERESDRQPPKEADFNGDFEAFNRALIAHETAELLRSERSADVQHDIQERQREIHRERLIDHNERVADARKVIPDYDEVIEKGLSKIDGAPKNLELLLESEKSELIAYHLAEKPERAREYARMTPLEAAKHIGKLEARLSLPKPRTKTEAPPPVAPLKGGAAPQADPSKMSMAEYAKWFKDREKAS